MTAETLRYKKLITEYARSNYKLMLREPDGQLKHRFIVPGSVYSNSLWDWDSWLTDIALRGIEGVDTDELASYEKGCILNFAEHTDGEGRVPISIMPASTLPDFSANPDTNIHKPCFAQHALFICDAAGDTGWVEDAFPAIERYLAFYKKNAFHEDSGLYVWIDDCAIGVDNDPCTFYRPKRSSASIYLNCFMYRELLASAELARRLGRADAQEKYGYEADELAERIRDLLWDPRDGFFYSADVNLVPVDTNSWLHSGCPRHWPALIQRIGVWSGFLPMWAEIATEEQAQAMVRNYLDESTFNAPFGVRSLSKAEKMYALLKTGNPSCWLGPIWGIANYMVYDGLKKYGYEKEASELAEKTIRLFGTDLEKTGVLHEYYHPETGEPMNNPGFQNWNLLSILMEC